MKKLIEKVEVRSKYQASIKRTLLYGWRGTIVGMI